MEPNSVFSNTVLEGRVALITGGGSGIGLEIATQFGKHGAKVAIMGRRQKVLDAAVSYLESHGVEAIGLQGDVRKKDDASRVVNTVVEQFGKLDILVNGAAGNFLVAAEDLSPNGFKTVMDIDALGTFTMSNAALQYLKKGGQGKSPLEGGVILNISTTFQYSAEWYQIHVTAAKVSLSVFLSVWAA
jgi:peroxisomal 2,4-dienoyl-CoA reductase